MATREVVRDQKPAHIAPNDESVIIPEAVRRASKRAEEFYQPAEPTPPQEPTPEAPPPAAAAPPEPTPQAEPLPEPAAPPVQPDPPSPPGDTNWEHRYLSMKGRYDQSQQVIGSMQEQMVQLGDELVRVQNALAAQGQPPRAAQPPAPAPKLVTSQDEEVYGTDLIDFTMRAAKEAIAPELTRLEQENARLQKRLQTTTRQTMGAFLDTHVPNWREINASNEWKNWLRLPDLYSRQVRQKLLDAAYQAADAPTVVEFFKGFMASQAANQQGDLSPPQPQEPQAPAPRQAAVPIQSLAAPGRARPASGTDPGAPPADKPIFTRKQISDFYDSVRKGAYAGREVEKERQEQAIFAAQREGRVR